MFIDIVSQKIKKKNEKRHFTNKLRYLEKTKNKKNSVMGKGYGWLVSIIIVLLDLYSIYIRQFSRFMLPFILLSQINKKEEEEENRISISVRMFAIVNEN